MARGSSTLLVLLLSACLLHCAIAVTHIVGGDKGWTTKNITATFYDEWAAKQTFNVDDKLLFVYEAATHNVWVVPVVDLDSCNAANAVEKYEDANATVELYRSGDFAFICQYAGHCTAGMKMKLTVEAAAPAAGPAPSNETPPAPPEVPAPEEDSAPVVAEPPPADTAPPSAASSLRSIPALVAGGLLACVVALLL